MAWVVKLEVIFIFILVYLFFPNFYTLSTSYLHCKKKIKTVKCIF